MHDPEGEFTLDRLGSNRCFEVLERADAFSIELGTQGDGVTITGEYQRDRNRGRGSAIHAQGQGDR